MSPWNAAEMRRKRFPWILLSLPLLSLLAACSPPDEPLVALAVQDGQPVGVLVTCDDSSARVGVFENDHPGDVSERPLFTWSVSGRPTSEVVEVPLFGQPPDGWEVNDIVDISAAEAGMAVDVEPLTELRPGVTYSVSGRARHKAISVDFTLADFPRIGPDEVLVPRGRDTTKVVSREAFLRKARDSC
ncbi:hypothetical protein [Micromonospora sp. LH3U1]|uniref:hypothetical protein n=1 Tax=Micromonospora sp. LH3U1 TaxID=3018339 RepID=UPI00234A9237|nr:hypothetical protein [Micromonospora sp. LH3U1]WCN84039.1 hypothetical protein PCA76_13820 [Micromonospora sp. LH3U1]